MSYQVLARKWRPQLFEDVIGQGHIARALQNAVKVQKVAHAYLFSGPRGVGKTTMARILAKALNCLQGPTPTPCNGCSSCQEIASGTSVDVLEIDGASNTSVEDVRELRETIKYIPFQGKYKIYIIDEVHMLSNSAFNALLKTLEEPPPHIVFIFATTEPHKIPLTIRSRCQHFQFKRISRRDIVNRLQQIAAQERVQIGQQELFLLAKGAEGSMRDALSLLDQALAYGGDQVRQEDLLTVMGVVDRQQIFALVRAVQKKDASEAVALVQGLVDQGHDLRQFCFEMVEVLRDLIMFKITKHPADLVECPPEELEELQGLSQGFSVEDLQWLFTVFSQTLEEIRTFFYPPFLLEMAVVRATRLGSIEPIEAVVEKVMNLEERLRDTKNTGFRQIEADTQGSPASKPEDAVSVPRAGGPDATARWQNLIQLAKEKRPYLASYLEKGVLTDIKDGELVLGYPKTSSFFIDLIQKDENLSLIRLLLGECFEKDLKFRVILLGEDKITDMKTGEHSGVSEVHPLVKEAIKILGGEVVDPNRG